MQQDPQALTLYCFQIFILLQVNFTHLMLSLLSQHTLSKAVLLVDVNFSLLILSCLLASFGTFYNMCLLHEKTNLQCFYGGL